MDEPRFVSTRRFGAIARCVALGALLTGCGDTSTVDRPFAPQEPGALLVPGPSVTPWHPSVLRARRARLGRDLARDLRGPVRFAQAGPVALALFDDVRLEVTVSALRRGLRGPVWVGRVAGDPTSEVILVPRGTALVGTVRTNGRLFEIRHRPDGDHIVIERDEGATPPEAPPMTPEASGGAVGPLGGPGAVDPLSGLTVIDVLLPYTGAARSAAGGSAAIEALAELAVAQTNEGYAASGIAIHLRLVGTMEVAYDEGNFNWSTTLERLAIPNDGYMDEVPPARDALGADAVALIVNTVGPYAGLGYTLSAGNQGVFPPYAYSLVARSYAVAGHTYAHELGHNMGAVHDHDASSPSSGYYPYSFGQRRPEANYRTVMAYACASSCPRVNRWSSPGVTFAGVPTGIEDWSDNSRSLNNTAGVVSNFRPTVVPLAADVAALASPAAGTTVDTSAAITLSWDDVGADRYHVSVGHEQGGTDLADLDVGSDTAAVVAVPPDAGAFHVRLWSRTPAAGWFYRDHTLFSATPPSYGTRLLYPAPGSTLEAAAMHMQWTDSGAAEYRIQVGTLDAPAAFFEATTQHTGMFVGALPNDGREVIVRVGARGAYGWHDDINALTAYTAPDYVPHVLHPQAGGSLFGPRPSIRWSDSGSDSHSIWIFRQDGTVVFDAFVGGNIGVVTEGLPQDGSALVAVIHGFGPQGWGETSFAFRSQPAAN